MNSTNGKKRRLAKMLRLSLCFITLLQFGSIRARGEAPPVVNPREDLDNHEVRPPNPTPLPRMGEETETPPKATPIDEEVARVPTPFIDLVGREAAEVWVGEEKLGAALSNHALDSVARIFDYVRTAKQGALDTEPYIETHFRDLNSLRAFFSGVTRIPSDSMLDTLLEYRKAEKNPSLFSVRKTASLGKLSGITPKEYANRALLFRKMADPRVKHFTELMKAHSNDIAIPDDVAAAYFFDMRSQDPKRAAILALDLAFSLKPESRKAALGKLYGELRKPVAASLENREERLVQERMASAFYLAVYPTGKLPLTQRDPLYAYKAVLLNSVLLEKKAAMRRYHAAIATASGSRNTGLSLTQAQAELAKYPGDSIARFLQQSATSEHAQMRRYGVGTLNAYTTPVAGSTNRRGLGTLHPSGNRERLEFETAQVENALKALALRLNSASVVAPKEIAHLEQVLSPVGSERVFELVGPNSQTHWRPKESLELPRAIGSLVPSVPPVPASIDRAAPPGALVVGSKLSADELKQEETLLVRLQNYLATRAGNDAVLTSLRTEASRKPGTEAMREIVDSQTQEKAVVSLSWSKSDNTGQERVRIQTRQGSTLVNEGPIDPKLAVESLEMSSTLTLGRAGLPPQRMERNSHSLRTEAIADRSQPIDERKKEVRDYDSNTGTVESTAWIYRIGGKHGSQDLGPAEQRRVFLERSDGNVTHTTDDRFALKDGKEVTHHREETTTKGDVKTAKLYTIEMSTGQPTEIAPDQHTYRKDSAGNWVEDPSA